MILPGKKEDLETNNGCIVVHNIWSFKKWVTFKFLRL